MVKLSLKHFTRLVTLAQKGLEEIKSQLDLKNPGKLTIFKLHLETEYSEFNDELRVYKSLETLPEGIQDEDFYRAVQQIKSLYLTISSDIQLALDSSHTEAKPNTPSDVVGTSANLNSRIHLPKITIPVFEGQFEEWNNFFAKFTSIIHSNPDLNNLEKFQYLFTNLKGDPLAMIQHLALSEENYLVALDILKKRYSNVRRLITFHCTKLLQMSQIESRSIDSIRQFLDAFKMHSTSLKSLNDTNLFEAFFCTFVLSKFDKSLASRFENQTSSSTDFPTLDNILSFLETQAIHSENVQTISTISGSKAQNKPDLKSLNRYVPKNTPRVAPHTALFVNNTDNRTICSFCDKHDHKSSTCPIFIGKNPKQRFELAKQGKLCINCLGKHFVSSCRSKYTCRICKKKHHTMLHFDSHSNTRSDDTASVNSHTSSIQSQKSFRSDHRSSASANVTTMRNNLSPNRSSNRSSQTLNKQHRSQYHSTSFEPKQKGSENSEQKSKVDTQQTSLLVSPLNNSTVLIPTALVCLRVSQTQHVVARAIIDTASHVSFITEKCAQNLQCKRNRVSISIAGIGQTPASSNGVCQLNLETLGGKTVAESHPFFILNKITTDLPRLPIDSSIKSQLSFVTLSDPTFDTPSPVEVLLGADLSASIIQSMPHQPKPHLPFLLYTQFGYVVMGTAASSSTVVANLSTTEIPAFTCLNVTAEENLSNQIEKFWSQEEPPSPLPLSTEEDTFCENFYSTTTTRDPHGRYIVRLPFKPDCAAQLGSSFNLARNCFLSLEQRFDSQPEFKQKYVDFMCEYLKLGHMKPIPKYVEPKYFIPHHGVFKTHGDTSKLRVVFNASAKSLSGFSLNDLLYAGPKLQPLIANVILRFRKYPIVFACDIKQMYRQVQVDSRDQPYQCILWRESPDKPLQTFMLTTVTYGVASAPYLALRTLKQLVNDNGHDYPLASKILQNNIFVDDIITGADSINEALSLRFELTNLLFRGCFELRKWCSNCRNLLKDIPLEHQELSTQHNSNVSQIHILGLTWNPLLDNFRLNLPNATNLLSTPLTKRKLLSFFTQIYDPCGWLSPVVMRAKCFIQQLWLLNLDWDEEISLDSIPNLLSFLNSFQSFSNISLPRLAAPPSANYQIHGFCDSSEKGFAAAVYLRSDFNGLISTSLLSSKTRVAPLKTLSIPRLELSSAHLLAQLIKNTLDIFSSQLSITSVHLWSDSTIVLAWIRTPSYKLKTFVSNRIAFVQEHTQLSWWNYVPTALNIADVPSRGLDAIELASKDYITSWFEGPEWLCREPTYWPQSSSLPSIETNLLELKPQTSLITTQQPIDLFNHVSSWPKAVRLVSRIFQNWLPSCSSLSHAQNYRKAEHALCKYIQSVSFGDELKNLKLSKPCSKHVQQLSPFLEDNLIRVGGRLSNAELPFAAKHPILLPKSHHLVTALVDYYHVVYAHCGPSFLQSILLQRFWIMSCRRIVRSRVLKCIRCFRTKPTNSMPIMGELPTPRVVSSLPFVHTGMDFAGPFPIRLVSLRKSRVVKFYLCIFVCFSTKALHLELVEDLSTPAFIEALHRFISRRGVPAHLYSDCGTNFVGASKELRKRLLQFLSDNDTKNSLVSFASSKGITFHFLPPASPHQGGIWESAVKCAKYHIKRVLGAQIPTLMQFLTLINRIEAILNSRPLGQLSSDPNDFQVLTPSHFLIQRSLTCLPEPDLVLTESNRLKHFQQIQALTQRFWRHWSRAYLTTLQRRSKWHTPVRNLEANDLVIVSEPHTPPMSWPIGRVIKVFPGKDNVVRVASIKTQKGEYTRSVSKLFRLPTSEID